LVPERTVERLRIAPQFLFKLRDFDDYLDFVMADLGKIEVGHQIGMEGGGLGRFEVQTLSWAASRCF
jgi:hypothetical protein